MPLAAAARLTQIKSPTVGCGSGGRLAAPLAPWLLRPQPRAQPCARLFCFPHAGVGASAYRLWPAGLPSGLELCAVQLPGRETRFGEPALSSIADIVQALVPALEPHLDLPFAFFGHSMGAVIASEVARALGLRGSRLPEHLVVSARRPPHVPDLGPPLHGLPDAEFAAEINRRYGGIPEELLQHADVMALLLPSLRADITALETHRPSQREPLDIPITVLGGSHDSLTPREHLDAWQGETRRDFRIRVFDGDHFYLKPQLAAVLAELTATLAPLWSTTRSAEHTR
jgi:surfactin synthase thioesterase subunit